VDVAGAVVQLSDLESSELEDQFSATTFKRGRSYARGNRVLSLEWDEDEQMLSASVVGHGAIYDTSAYFEGEGDELAFADGECTCPVGWNCKHVVAILLAATEQRRRQPARGAVSRRQVNRRARPAPARPPAPPAWDQSLQALVAARRTPAVGKPLAVEMFLTAPGSPGHGQPRLMARLMRPGARGGWVNGSLDWGGLDSWHVRDGGYREDHLAVIRELHAVYRVRDTQASHIYGYGSDRTIDLSGCESPQLWPLLDEAARLGLPLIHAHPGLGEIAPPVPGELVLDVTRDGSGGLGVAVVLRVGEVAAEDLVPVRLIGRAGHGIVCAARADVDAGGGIESWRLRLVRLARPAAPQLERMLLSGERLAVPESEIGRFGEELCPALRHIAPVVSSDGSFTPPLVSDPALVLRAQYGPGTLVTLGWEWEYTVGDNRHRAPLGAEAASVGFRDDAAERDRVAATVIDEPALHAAGLLDNCGRPAAIPPAALVGFDSLHLATEVLPRLVDHPGVRVDASGDAPDYRDVGDSLTVGVSTAEISGEQDWFDLGVTIAVNDREVPFVEVFSALARGETRMLLDDGAHFSLEDPRLASLRALIEEARTLVDSPSAPLRISRYQAGLWSELTELGIATEQAERWQRAVAPLLELDALPVHDEPAGLRAQLRPYQREGFTWLAAIWDLELGGILADDMGLGKTVQALALISHVLERSPATAPFLVVAPTSVAPNWAAEAARFAPGLSVDVVLDTMAKSGRTIDAVATANVVVTTYTLFRLDADAYGQVPWAGLILDEAQFVKNHRGKTYRCARDLATPFKLAITGTPMENNLMELWALLSLTSPGLFPDPQRFAEHYARPIERDRDRELLARLRRRIKPLVKRRTKELVASELPPKQEQTLEVELHPRHRKLYDTHLQRERQRVLQLLDDFEHNRITILRSITRLRQMSLHPALVDARHEAVPSAKLDTLVEQLDDVISSGHRALVFSQFTTFLGRVRDRLSGEGIACCYLDGRTRRRDKVLERFRSGQDPVFLISLKAGGVGLNLTEADYCFLLDPWWNPATEAQAIDRTHRIGQTRQVMVYRLIAHDTIEEKVRALARRKAELFSGVLDDGDLFAGAITAEDIRGLLS
jgi:superfamily II DNA or RNA helicase